MDVENEGRVMDDMEEVASITHDDASLLVVVCGGMGEYGAEEFAIVVVTGERGLGDSNPPCCLHEWRCSRWRSRRSRTKPMLPNMISLFTCLLLFDVKFGSNCSR